jgi:streptomycin 3"-adenylyltransferase
MSATRDALPLDASSSAQIEAVVSLVRRVLGADAVGGYLGGSAVLGGLRPDSDLDVLVVARRRVSADERRALIDGLLPISGRHATGGPARSLEVSVVALPEIRPWRYPPRIELQYGDWLRPQLERGDPAPWDDPNPDLAVLLTSILGASRTLFGTDAPELLDPIPPADLRRSMVHGIPGLLADLEGDTRNVILTLARIWTSLSTGEIHTKDAAAAWASARLRDGLGSILTRARAMYLGEEPDASWNAFLPEALATADRLVEEIRRADRASAPPEPLAIVSRPNTAPCGSATSDIRPPGKSSGASSSRPPASTAAPCAASTSFTAK